MGDGTANGANNIKAGQNYCLQVDEETSSEELMFMDRIKVKNGVIIIRNPSTTADEPKHLVGLGISNATHLSPSFLVLFHVTPKC